MNPTPEDLQTFEEAFSSHGGGSHRTCECGREYYNPSGGWDWSRGELERLEKTKEATALEYTVQTLIIEGRTYVMDCDCWHKRAREITAFLDSHAQRIADYLTREKKRKQAEADASPVVKEVT